MSDQPELLIRVLDGPQKGTRVPVRDGLTLGRKDGDLIVRDPKLSIRHARIEWKETDWVLIDLGSSNKIKVEGTRYDEIALYVGLQFTLGGTLFEVVERPKLKSEDETGFEFTGSIEVPVEALSWKELINGVLTKAAVKARKSERPSAPALKPFPSVVRLEFLSGPQHGTVWHIGYGPREIGAHSFDLSIIDDAATGSCFLLDTAGGKVLLSAAAGANVRVNGTVPGLEPIELRSGDRIEIGKTRIRAVVG